MTLCIHHASPVPVRTAKWLSALLLPAIAAARIENPPPLELRWLGGDIAGLCLPLDCAPDGRLFMSHRSLLWHPQTIICVYLHEAAHRLLGHGAHDASFFALLHVMLARCDAAGVTSGGVSNLGLYDLQCVPAEVLADGDGGVGRALTWSVRNAVDLAGQDLTAEQLAAAVLGRHLEWLGQLRTAPSLALASASRRNAEARAVRAELQRLAEKIFTRNVLVCALASLLVLLVIAHGHSL